MNHSSVTHTGPRPGRPSAAESQRRAAAFLAMAAAGVRLDVAAQRAGLKPMRALRLVSDRDAFEATLSQLRKAAA